MKIGDLVFEVPFGKEWFKHNPYLSNSAIGIVVEVVDFETMYIMWSSGDYAGEISMMNTDYLEKVNGSR